MVMCGKNWVSRERELESSIKHLISAVLNKQEWHGGWGWGVNWAKKKKLFNHSSHSAGLNSESAPITQKENQMCVFLYPNTPLPFSAQNCGLLTLLTPDCIIKFWLYFVRKKGDNYYLSTGGFPFLLAELGVLVRCSPALPSDCASLMSRVCLNSPWPAARPPPLPPPRPR